MRTCVVQRMRAFINASEITSVISGIVEDTIALRLRTQPAHRQRRVVRHRERECPVFPQAFRLVRRPPAGVHAQDCIGIVIRSCHIPRRRAIGQDAPRSPRVAGWISPCLRARQSRRGLNLQCMLVRAARHCCSAAMKRRTELLVQHMTRQVDGGVVCAQLALMISSTARACVTHRCHKHACG